MQGPVKTGDPAAGVWNAPCPSCGKDNFTLQLRCSDCGAFIRDRIAALNLFSTLWGMLERPSQTVLLIGRSEQKNYTHLIFALCGPLLFALMLFLARIGDTTMPFGYMLLGIVLIGPLLGIAVFVPIAFFQGLLFRLSFGIRLRYRDAGAWLAWSLTPLVWTTVLILPILLGVFGLILFSTNPPPWSFLPLPFWMLSVLCVITLLWSMLLLPLGFRIHGPAYRMILLQQTGVWLLLAAAIGIGAALLHAFA